MSKTIRMYDRNHDLIIDEVLEEDPDTDLGNEQLNELVNEHCDAELQREIDRIPRVITYRYLIISDDDPIGDGYYEVSFELKVQVEPL